MYIAFLFYIVLIYFTERYAHDILADRQNNMTKQEKN